MSGDRLLTPFYRLRASSPTFSSWPTLSPIQLVRACPKRSIDSTRLTMATVAQINSTFSTWSEAARQAALSRAQLVRPTRLKELPRPVRSSIKDDLTIDAIQALASWDASITKTIWPDVTIRARPLAFQAVIFAPNRRCRVWKHAMTSACTRATMEFWFPLENKSLSSSPLPILPSSGSSKTIFFKISLFLSRKN